MSVSLSRVLGSPGISSMVGPSSMAGSLGNVPPARVEAMRAPSPLRDSVVDSVHISARLTGGAPSAAGPSPRDIARSRLSELALASSFGGYSGRRIGS